MASRRSNSKVKSTDGSTNTSFKGSHGDNAANSSSTADFVMKWYNTLAGESMDYVFVCLLLLAETLLGFLIIKKVPYTEIDWEAYMQEVDFWMGGEYDYRKIYGGTGPLVYPAGFLYLFGFLQWLTNYEVARAQPYFLLFYVATQAIVMAMYTMVARWIRKHQTVSSAESLTQTSHTIWSLRIAMGCLCLSKRFHSIFMLRLFNDAPTMLMAYFSFYCFMNQKWNIGCFLFSLAVSLKMNVLLFAPGLLYLLIQASPYQTIPRLAICAITQLVLGAPFLLRHPVSYLRKAFELDRQFFYKWTVNFKFLPEDVFLSKSWAILLLVLHLGLLGIYIYRVYRSRRPLTPANILSTLWVTNFIGMCCARTIHYQFYCWYFPSLPFLLWQETPYPIWLRLCCLGAIEYSYLTFPATPVSSLVLQIAHWAILLPCVFGPISGCVTATKDADLKQQ